jgi:hypothetical protein
MCMCVDHRNDDYDGCVIIYANNFPNERNYYCDRINGKHNRKISHESGVRSINLGFKRKISRVKKKAKAFQYSFLLVNISSAVEINWDFFFNFKL